MDDEKLQKVLARMGIGSRREMERWIEAGRIQVNNAVAKLGDRVTDKDSLKVDGQTVSERHQKETRHRVLLYNKPEGEISSKSDPEGRPTVFDRLPKLKGERWVSVGRLDFNTSGLMLFTTEGSLANALMHPSNCIEREYAVRIQGPVDDAMIERLKTGVMLEDGIARFTDVQMGRGEEGKTNKWYYVVVMEGRNREVRRLWESQGVTISRLKRVRYGNVFIPSKVKAGQWIELPEKDVQMVFEMAGLPYQQQAEKLLPKEKETLERQQRKHGRPAIKKSAKSRRPQDNEEDGFEVKPRRGRPSIKGSARPASSRSRSAPKKRR